jgi:hypothetical protein
MDYITVQSLKPNIYRIIQEKKSGREWRQTTNIKFCYMTHNRVEIYVQMTQDISTVGNYHYIRPVYGSRAKQVQQSLAQSSELDQQQGTDHPS